MIKAIGVQIVLEVLATINLRYEVRSAASRLLDEASMVLTRSPIWKFHHCAGSVDGGPRSSKNILDAKHN